MDTFSTLPELENRLHRMQAGDFVLMNSKEFEHLFGVNDVAAGRLETFARGHNCIALWAASGVKLLKKFPGQTGRNQT